jgi:hypothetical protein
MGKKTLFSVQRIEGRMGRMKGKSVEWRNKLQLTPIACSALLLWKYFLKFLNFVKLVFSLHNVKSSIKM